MEKAKQVLNIIMFLLIAFLILGFIAITVLEAIDWNILKLLDLDIDNH